MASPEVHHLFHRPIADHSFSADRKILAVAKDTALELYGKVGGAFKLKDELKGHDKTITGIDIAPNSGRIVTCSQDRNALVWEPSPTGYKPTLVLLRIARAATCVRWSPSETKFAVGSGDRVIAICYFEEENDWWVSKHLKKPIRSTITSVAWHPNSVLLAAGSTDAHARVFSGFIKGVDARPEPSVWGERLPFNTVCGEFLNNSAGWVHSVAFSPSGDALAFAAHDSSITVVYPTAPEQPPKAVISINTQLLPFMSLIWNGESEIIAAGYDCEAFRFKGSASGWELSGTLESKGRPGLGDAREESALNMFKQMDLKGKVKDDTQLKTVHQNTISTLRVYSSDGSSVSQFSTSGVDGRVVIWNVHRAAMSSSTSPSGFIYQKPCNLTSGLFTQNTSLNGSERGHLHMQDHLTGGHDRHWASWHSSGGTSVPQVAPGRPLRPMASPIEAEGFSLPFYPTTTPGAEGLARASSASAFPYGHHHLQEEDHLLEQDIHRDRGTGKRESNTPSMPDSIISRTISIHSSNSEQIHRLSTAIGRIQDICLEATKWYISSHHANRQARASISAEYPEAVSKKEEDDGDENKSDVFNHQHEFPTSPASQPAPVSSHQERQQEHTPPGQPCLIPAVSNSLLKNISGICNMLWAGSQRDRLVVLNVERLAVDSMARLLGWAETVALGDGDEWMLNGDETLRRALDAGTNLCMWLGVHEAVRDMGILQAQVLGDARDGGPWFG
ncbi:hypothetical protein JX265_005491 [Neoarthrinium moseri]|uniref:Arp2/3 complex 41 kDa subunit n=1 Tax=Neoarthrinium moseri TaxID=1658444 RepID=A0A9Q0AMT7_9PEZI|nr:hypothetical protein JX265_005491 [Neoarthrinium moseri]